MSSTRLPWPYSGSAHLEARRAGATSTGSTGSTPSLGVRQVDNVGSTAAVIPSAVAADASVGHEPGSTQGGSTQAAPRLALQMVRPVSSSDSARQRHIRTAAADAGSHHVHSGGLEAVMPQHEDAEQRASSVTAAMHVHPDVHGATESTADGGRGYVHAVTVAHRDLPPASVEECASEALPPPAVPLNRIKAIAVCALSHGSLSLYAW